jgi:hypothetical protein
MRKLHPHLTFVQVIREILRFSFPKPHYGTLIVQTTNSHTGSRGHSQSGLSFGERNGDASKPNPNEAEDTEHLDGIPVGTELLNTTNIGTHAAGVERFVGLALEHSSQRRINDDKGIDNENEDGIATSNSGNSGGQLPTSDLALSLTLNEVEPFDMKQGSSVGANAYNSNTCDNISLSGSIADDDAYDANENNFDVLDVASKEQNEGSQRP